MFQFSNIVSYKEIYTKIRANYFEQSTVCITAAFTHMISTWLFEFYQT